MISPRKPIESSTPRRRSPRPGGAAGAPRPGADRCHRPSPGGRPLEAHDDELGLDAGHGRKPLAALDLPLQRKPRTDIVGLPLEEQVGEHPGDCLVPGADDQAVEIGDRDLIGIGGPSSGTIETECTANCGPLPLQIASSSPSGTGFVFGWPSRSIQHDRTYLTPASASFRLVSVTSSGSGKASCMVSGSTFAAGAPSAFSADNLLATAMSHVPRGLVGPRSRGTLPFS